MTQEQFLYWLQGFAELSATPPTAEQWKSIREHLALCFKKVTPPVQTGLEKGAPDPMAVKSVEDFRRAMEDLRKHGGSALPPFDRAGIPNWPNIDRVTITC
jgi:hypothetical protein